MKKISEIKLVNESLKRFRVDFDRAMPLELKAETKYTKKWKYVPKVSDVTVVSVIGEVTEEKTDLDIRFSNGDHLIISTYSPIGPPGYAMDRKYENFKVNGYSFQLEDVFQKPEYSWLDLLGDYNRIMICALTIYEKWKELNHRFLPIPH